MKHIVKGDLAMASSQVKAVLKEPVSIASDGVKYKVFNESGVFLSNEEVERIAKWLTDYAEMLYYNGKSLRLNYKSDIREAKEVGDFLGMLRSGTITFEV